MTVDKGFSNVKIAEKFGGPGRNQKLIQIISIYTISLLSAVSACVTVTYLYHFVINYLIEKKIPREHPR